MLKGISIKKIVVLNIMLMVIDFLLPIFNNQFTLPTIDPSLPPHTHHTHTTSGECLMYLKI